MFNLKTLCLICTKSFCFAALHFTQMLGQNGLFLGSGCFHEYFDFKDPDLAAYLREEDKQKILDEYKKFTRCRTEYETVKLHDGVFALMSKGYSRTLPIILGFIVGNDFVLVIDAHFTGNMGKQIIDAVKKVTDLPIKYLVNLNAFGVIMFLVTMFFLNLLKLLRMKRPCHRCNSNLLTVAKKGSTLPIIF